VELLTAQLREDVLRARQEEQRQARLDSRAWTSAASHAIAPSNCCAGFALAWT
jgi:hypothetical protein